MGQGLRRRPRDADRGRARGPATRPAAGAGRRLPGRRARGRDGRARSTTASTAGAARRRRSTPRCTAWSTPPHVDHLHPDSGIALATAADGEALTRECFGDRVAWVPVAPARVPARPRHRRDPARRTRRRHRRDPRRPRDHRLGRHLRRVRGELARDHPDRRAVHRGARPAPSRSARVVAGYEPLPDGGAARARAAALLPVVRGLASTDRPQVGHFTRRARSSSTSSREAEHPRLAALGTSCPDHFLRTKVRPLVLDLPPTAPARARRSSGCASCTRPTATSTRAYYERHAEPDSPPMRGADPAIVLVPGRRDVQLRREQADRAGRRRVLRQRDQRHARRRGASRPTRRSPRREKFRIEYWALEEAKLRADADAEAARRRGWRS